MQPSDEGAAQPRPAPCVRFPGATAREVSLAQLDVVQTIPTQVYIVLLHDSDTVAADSQALIASLAAEFGEWADHHSMFGGKMISGTLSQTQVAWLLSNDRGVIQVIEADGQVGFDDGPGMGMGAGDGGGGAGADVGGGAGVGGGTVFAGGSPNFIMVDDERIQLNADTLTALTAAAASPYAQVEVLQAMQVCRSLPLTPAGRGMVVALRQTAWAASDLVVR